jgi:cellulose biosynthesis protein BcsQ
MGGHGSLSAPIVVIANFAGGTGKSTLSHALAVASAEYGKKALLIDLGGTGALTFKLGHERTRENAISCEERFDLRPNTATDSLLEILTNIPEKYDLILIDGPSSLTSDFEAVLKLTQLVILPVRESLHSLRGALSVIKVSAAPCKALAYFEKDSSVIAKLISSELKLLDAHISLAPEVLAAEKGSLSVLSQSKNSEVSQQYREAAYSLLEELNIF